MRGGTASTTVGTTFAGDAVGGVIWTVGEGGTAMIGIFSSVLVAGVYLNELGALNVLC